MTFWRFEKFGYNHLSAAGFQPNGIADFERHGRPPSRSTGREICARLTWPLSPSEITCHRSRGCIRAGAKILQKIVQNSAADLFPARRFFTQPLSCSSPSARFGQHVKADMYFHGATRGVDRAGPFHDHLSTTNHKLLPVAV